MKNLKYIFYSAALLCFAAACEQEVIDNSASPCPSDDPSIFCPEADVPPCPAEASAGSADFSKFVAIGTSYTAGFQAGALFTEGQNNSLGQILATQFECVGGGEFNQPSINSEVGYNIFITPNPVGNTVLGRFLLQGTPAKPAPTVSGTVGNEDALPNPQVNPGFMYSGDKSALNNFAVQATILAQIFSSATGNWANPNPAAGFSPFYARFASAPGSSTILEDAVAADPTFFMFWSGMDDYLLHAAFGGDPARAPLTPLEGGVGTGFRETYNAAIATILGSNANLKGVVANFPNVFALPYFTLVPYNPVPLAEADASAANSGYAGYNQVLDALKGQPFNYASADVDARKISFSAGNSPFVIIDETLNDYGDEFDILLAAGAITLAQRTALVPYEQVRLTRAGDIIPLSAGQVLGTRADPSNPASVRGIGVPLEDVYALIPSEITAIETARQGFNAAIAQVVTTYSTRLALADMNAAFNTFLMNKAAVSNNITITPSMPPPTGIYSEDGIHPNSRGYAFIANILIDAINEKFDASVPKADLRKHSATALPINP